MKSKQIVGMAAWAALLFGGTAYGQFAPGHVFVSIEERDACDFGGLEAIVEIDPSTGANSIFADSSDGLCQVSGLRFTPDHQRLLALNGGHSLPPTDVGWVQSFAADGTSTVILDESDGIRLPFGANGLAFNSDGDLFILNVGAGILRFPAGGGPATVFSSEIITPGGLDFAPNGDLFYAGGGLVLRIAPDGVWSEFDTLPAPSSLVFDRQGNLFVAAGQAGVGPTIYRYDDGDPNSRRILASGFVSLSGIPLPITLSPDESLVYFIERGGTLYAIDAQDGATTVVADLSNLPVDMDTPAGITVNNAPPGPIPTVSEWGLAGMTFILLTVGTLLLRRRKAHDVASPSFVEGGKS